jgi:hypothetical protein
VDYRDRGRTDSQKIIAMAVVRYREENGDLSRKHGSILIRTLRETYGLGFAPGCADHAKTERCAGKIGRTVPESTDPRSRSREARTNLPRGLAVWSVRIRTWERLRQSRGCHNGNAGEKPQYRLRQWPRPPSSPPSPEDRGHTPCRR